MDTDIESKTTKRLFVETYTRLYQTNGGTIPTTPELARACDISPSLALGLVEDEVVRQNLVRRGVPLSRETDYLTPKQLVAIAHLTDSSRKDSLKRRLVTAGVTYQQHTLWLKNPRYKAEFEAFASDILDSSVAQVNMGLVNAAAAGKVDAIKHYNELTGRYDPNSKTVLDTMAIMAGVVEIIQDVIKDPEQLRAIAGKLAMLSAKAGLPA